MNCTCFVYNVLETSGFFHFVLYSGLIDKISDSRGEYIVPSLFESVDKINELQSYKFLVLLCELLMNMPRLFTNVSIRHDAKNSEIK